MSHQFDKVKKKLTLKAFKFNLCTKKVNKPLKDYDYAPYEPTNETLVHNQLKDEFELNRAACTPCLANIHHQDNTPIINREVRIFNNIYANFTRQVLSESVSLNQKSIASLTYNEIPNNNIYLNEIELAEEDHMGTNYAFSNEEYSSPVSSSFHSSNVSKSTSKCDCSCFEENYTSKCPCQDSFDSVGENKSNEESYFDTDNERLYVCCKAYRAKMDGDLSLRFTDRVKLIHQNDDIALVKNVLDGKCGYVPRDCITTISEFLSEIQYFS